MATILSNLTRFKKKFTGRFLGKFVVKWILKIPPHGAYVAALYSCIHLDTIPYDPDAILTCARKPT